MDVVEPALRAAGGKVDALAEALHPPVQAEDERHDAAVAAGVGDGAHRGGERLDVALGGALPAVAAVAHEVARGVGRA